MSYSGRPSATADRRTSTYPAPSRPRVPTATPEAQESRPTYDRHNSINARRQTIASTLSERRTERRDVQTRETVAARPRSPLKSTSESRVNARKSREEKVPVTRVAATATVVVPAPTKKVEEKQWKLKRRKAAAAWNPHATLIPHTTAPLATRISVPPLASTAPQSLEPLPLRDMSMEAQEKAIIEDLLFVFMGFEGQYIRFAEDYNPSEEKERLVGPIFRIMPGLDPSLRDLTTSMLKMASHYTALEAFIEVQSREEFGAVNHALCAAVRKLLKDYLVLMAQLENQSLTNATFTLHVLNLHIKPTSHMLFQLYTLGLELLKANGILDDEDEDSLDETDGNIEDILESLRDGGQGPLSSKKMCKGGSTLGLITKRLASMSGDPSARTLLTTLLREASRPYMAMLNEWLHHGGIKDPHAEFLIKEQKSIKRERLDQDYTDEYWEKRYTMRDNLVPPQLEAVKDKVLLAGKYLNVVRECGGVDISQTLQDVPTTFDDPGFLDNVNTAYASANSSLLDLLLTTHALPARLRSLKHYFFLDRSDFFSYFLELSNSELRKPAKHVNIGKLQSLLDIVLRQPGSVAAEDPFKDDVKVEMDETTLTNWLMKIVNVTGLDQDAANSGSLSNYLTTAAPQTTTDDKDLTGFDALVLDYSMPFPLSLVVSRVTLTRYQLLFRYLLSLRHLETLLINSWINHSTGPAWKHRSKNPKIERWKRKAWTLRARMLCFVQQLLYYCTAEVIEPNWQGLMSRLEGKGAAGVTASSADGKVKRTVDELMQDHVDFLATCLKECMLTNPKLLRINSKILATCTWFANYTASFQRYLIAADAELVKDPKTNPSSANPPSSATTNGNKHQRSQSGAISHDPAKLDTLVDLLQKYEDNFTRHLKVLLDALNYLAATETVTFLSLCSRLSTASEGLAGVGAPAYA